MEIEAKFTVADEGVFSRLVAAEQFGTYIRRDTQVKRVHDRYVDTADRRFYDHQVYARLREDKDSGEMLLTLKRFGVPADGAVLNREEYQTTVPGLDVAQWPDGIVRRVTEKIAEDAPLTDLITIDQTRIVSILQDGPRAVAECSIDEVTMRIPGGPVRAYELEIELLPDGMPADLTTLSKFLTGVYGLTPQPLSKFERAMLLASAPAAPRPSTVFPNAGQSSESVPAEPHPNGNSASEHYPPAAYSDSEPDQSRETVSASVPAVDVPDIAGIEPFEPPSFGKPSYASAASQNVTQDVGLDSYAEANLEMRIEADKEMPQTAALYGDAPDEDEEAQHLDVVDADAVARTIEENRILPTDTMRTAGRKLLSAYLRSMMANEDGARTGKDPEAVHDMRVATRRIRAVFQVLDPYLQGEPDKRVRRQVRSLTRALGRVRDLDVLIAGARTFQHQLPSEEQSDMDGLLDEWSAQRKRMRKKLIRLLNSKDYKRLTRRMQRFLRRDKGKVQQIAEAVLPQEVRHAAGSAIWSQYEAVRAFEDLMEDPIIEQLHALRITGKYLRYTLECFRDALPGDADDLIRDVVQMQDELGNLQDADIAAELARAYLDEHRERSKKKKKKAKTAPQLPGLAVYLMDRENAISQIQANFPDRWAVIAGPEWRKRLAVAIAGL